MKKSLRFEVLKRDGFRCAYCGVTSAAELLHVDHVVPVSKGGTDDLANLVSACVACNLGKSAKGLAERPAPTANAEAMLEHAEQVRAYLEAQKALIEAKEETVEYLCDVWRERIKIDPPRRVVSRFRNVVRDVPITKIVDAIEATAAGAWQLRTAEDETRYFNACLRNQGAA